VIDALLAAGSTYEGCITYQEMLESLEVFDTVAAWLEAYHTRSLHMYTTIRCWDCITADDLICVYGSQTWAPSLILTEFQRILYMLGVNGESAGPLLFSVVNSLQDTGPTEPIAVRDLFFGLTLLLPVSPVERMRCMFSLMDVNQSGQVSYSELGAFLAYIVPAEEIQKNENRVLWLADKLFETSCMYQGVVTFREFNSSRHLHIVMDWLSLSARNMLDRIRVQSSSTQVTQFTRRPVTAAALASSCWSRRN